MKLSAKITSLIPIIFLCAITVCRPVNAGFDEENYEALIEPEIKESDVLIKGCWQYYDMGDSLCVCGYTGKEEKITVPSEIDGKIVRKISGRRTGLGVIDKQNMLFGNDTVKEVIVPEGITAVGIYAFDGGKIEKITLPKSLVSIGYKAFCACTLTSVTIPENVKIIAKSAFSSSKLEEIYLPEGLESIGEFAFDNTPLKRIYIPDSVAGIGQYAFRNTDLEEITLPKGLVTAESRILANCRNLKRVCISEGTVKLESDLFDGCASLEEIYLPSTLSISDPILYHNYSIKNIYFAATESEYVTMFAKFGESFADIFIGEGWRREEGFSQLYENIKITYNVPVPLAEPIPYPEESSKLDGFSIMLLIITVLGITFTVPLLIAFIRRITESKRKKEEEKIREAEEGFHPRVLGLWQCAKCGTPNSPIANYCYKCGRKGGTR